MATALEWYEKGQLLTDMKREDSHIGQSLFKYRWQKLMRCMARDFHTADWQRPVERYISLNKKPENS